MLPASTTAVSAILPSLREEWKRHGVRHAWFFGSRARGEENPSSDWDFLVEFEAPPSFDTFMGLKISLEEKLGTQVDLLSRSACKPRFLEAIRSDLIDVT